MAEMRKAARLAILLAVMLSRVLGRQETKSIGNEQAPVAAVWTGLRMVGLTRRSHPSFAPRY